MTLFATGYGGTAFLDRHLASAAVKAEPTSPVAPGPIDGDPNDTLTRVVTIVETDERDAVDAIAADPAVVSARPVGDGLVAVELDAPAEAANDLPGVIDVEDDPTGMQYVGGHFPHQWGLENTGQSIFGTPGTAGADIRWRDAHARSTGHGVTVAVIDSGIDLSHPDLVGRGWRNTAETCGNGRDDDGNGYVDDCYGWDFVNDDPEQYDTHTAWGAAVDNRHGTHVAGSIAANAGNGYGIAGVAPDVTIMPLKIAENGSFPLSRAALAVRYAVDNGADIINASWGTAPGTSGGTALAQAVEHAEANGVVFVAAAGNSNADIDVHVVHPAALPNANVVSVGASDNRDLRASFSNYGHENVDLYAPGWYVLSTVPDASFQFMSGTSMAAPHVAGVAALLLAAGIPPRDVPGVLRTTAEPVNALAGLAVSSGRLDAAEALGDARAPEAGHEDGTWFTGLTGLVADRPVEPGVTVRASAVTAPSHVDATLAYLHGGALHAVVDHPVSVDGKQTTTDGEGIVRLSSSAQPAALAAGVSADVSSSLPAGDYALLVELDDGETRSAPAAVLFTVAEVPVPGETPPDAGTVPVDPPPATNPSNPDQPADGSEPDDGTSPGSGPTPDDGASPSPDDGTAPAPSDPEPKDGATPPSQTSPDTGTTPPPSQPVPSDPSDPDPLPSDPSDPDPPASAPAPSPTSPPASDPEPSPSQPPASSGYVFPNSGPTSGGSSVQVKGSFPDDVYVHFGASHATVTFVGNSEVHVKTPARVAGTVDVTVLARGGAVLAFYPQAYTYVDDGGSNPPPSDTSPSHPSEPGSGTDPSPSDPGSDPSPSEPASRVAGEPFSANGLTLVALVSTHPLYGVSAGAWQAARCASDPCVGFTPQGS